MTGTRVCSDIEQFLTGCWLKYDWTIVSSDLPGVSTDFESALSSQNWLQLSQSWLKVSAHSRSNQNDSGTVRTYIRAGHFLFLRSKYILVKLGHVCSCHFIFAFLFNFNYPSITLSIILSIYTNSIQLPISLCFHPLPTREPASVLFE